MADPYAETRPELKRVIIARVTEGATLKGLAREPGMPSDSTIRNWARDESLFGYELAQALRIGAWRRRWMCDEAKAEAFLTRYRTGEPIRAILADPDMPSGPVLMHWRRTRGWFGAEVERLKDVHAPHRLRGLKAAKARPAWDEAVADRIMLRVGRGEGLRRMVDGDPTLPGMKTVARWRREHPEFDRVLKISMEVVARRRARRRCAALTEIILARIIRGASLHSLGREPDMPCARTLYRWIAENPQFARMVAMACEDRQDTLVHEVLAVSRNVTPGAETATLRRMTALKKQVGRLQHRPGRKWTDEQDGL